MGDGKWSAAVRRATGGQPIGQPMGQPPGVIAIATSSSTKRRWTLAPPTVPQPQPQADYPQQAQAHVQPVSKTSSFQFSKAIAAASASASASAAAGSAATRSSGNTGNNVRIEQTPDIEHGRPVLIAELSVWARLNADNPIDIVTLPQFVRAYGFLCQVDALDNTLTLHDGPNKVKIDCSLVGEVVPMTFGALYMTIGPLDRVPIGRTTVQKKPKEDGSLTLLEGPVYEPIIRARIVQYCDGMDLVVYRQVLRRLRARLGYSLVWPT